MTTQIGVSELRMPASELSILKIAMAKQKAGNRLPKIPARMIVPIFLLGSFAIWKTANGRNIMAAENIRNAAICGPVRPFRLTFMSIKELPQIKQSNMKIDQLMNLLLIK